MRRAAKAGVEEIEIRSFEKPPQDDPEGVSIATMVLGVPMNSSPFALAAMLKGFHEFYLKPLANSEQGYDMPPEMVNQYEHNLMLWVKAHPPKSKIIL